jgi:hypothetical protein
METYTIKYEGIELEVYANYNKGSGEPFDPIELIAIEIKVEGVDILPLLPYTTVLCIEHEVVDKYELA